MDRWEERSSRDEDDDPATTVKHTPPLFKMNPPLPPIKSSLRSSSSISLDEQQAQHEYQPRCNLLPDSCILPLPGLALLSDSEDSSFTSSSCGTEEFFDFEDLSNALQLMEKWKKRNKVRFGKAKVREYSLTVGDHPICKDGLALSLDWNYSAERVYNVDAYERHRLRKRKSAYRGRRTSRLDYWQRREILQRVGSFSNHELSRIQRQRQEQAVSEFLASAGPDRLDPSEYEDDDYDDDDVDINTREEEPLQGVELLEMEHPEDDLITGLSYYDPMLDWHMKVEVIED